MSKEPDPRINARSFSLGLPNTRIDYLYRDVNNYKQESRAVFPGALTLQQAQSMVDALDEDDGFVPSAVGLPDLQDETVNGWNADEDQPFHEIISISLVATEPTEAQIADDFLARFVAADWALEGERVEREHATEQE